ncbi:MAG TPA: DUF1259 domain-containing protein [Longimicrobiales bacterium]|nr:DUF1259 domain-containing protein [Longimicrobiales bacterium]
MRFETGVLVLLMLACVLRPGSGSAQTVNWQAIDEAIGRSGTPQDGGVRRYGFPRSDLQVTADGVAIRPAFALGSWAAFLPTSRGRLVMGDLVLREAEIPAVMDALQSGGIEQTAIHHHILNESPRILYTHIHAHGGGVAIARTIRNALGKTGTPAPAPAGSPPALDLDTIAVGTALGHAGRANGGVYQVSVAGKDRVTMDGVDVPMSMGLATVINFQPTGSRRAAITGDFVLTGSQVNPVIRALRKNGIVVTALHNHLLNEQPRQFFMHFWANDDAVRLARGLREALDAMK